MDYNQQLPLHPRPELSYPGRSLLQNNCLRLDGQTVPLLSGEMHFFRMDPQVWEQCLRQIQSFGLPIVSTYLSWRRFSLGPGKYDLIGRSDPRLDLPRFLDLCRQMSLWTILKPGPWICAEEVNGGYPDWLVQNPDLQALDAQGSPVAGYMGPFQSPIPSYLHPEYQNHVRGWLRAVDEIVREYVHPHGPVILMQLDNEPCYTFHDQMFETDYNPVQLSYYPRWLEAKYRTVGELNRAHRTKHALFSEVQPPRSLEGLGPEKLPCYLDWVEFKEWTLARHVARIGELHLENGVDSLLFTINLNEHSQLATPNNWQKLERASGTAGFDYYPASMPMGVGEFVKVTQAVNYSRCALRAAWSPEIMCGIWNFEGQEHMSNHLRAEDFEYLYFTCLAFGLKGMNFYMLADRDNWVNSPLNERGERTPSAAAVDRVMQFFRAVPQFPVMDRPQPVGILYYPPYAQEAFAIGGRPLETDPGLFGQADLIFAQAYTSALRDNLDPAVVDLDACPDALKNAHLLFSPGGRYMDRATQERLKAYVGAGGALVFLSSPPELDEHMEPFSLFPNRPRRALMGRGWVLSLNPNQLETAMMDLARELDLLPEVQPDHPGVLTTCQFGENGVLLFVINTHEGDVQTSLHFRRREIGRLVDVLRPQADAPFQASQAQISLPPHKVSVYWLRS